MTPELIAALRSAPGAGEIEAAIANAAGDLWLAATAQQRRQARDALLAAKARRSPAVIAALEQERLRRCGVRR